MFDHVVFSTSDYEASKAFYLKALEPIGIEVLAEDSLGIEMSADGETSLCIRRVEAKPSHLHLAFKAESQQQVDDFYRAALEAGAKDNGAPGIRPNYSGNYYAAFVIGPDGHNIELVYRQDKDEQAANTED